MMAYLENEAAADQVEDLLERAEERASTVHMSLINLGEIAYIVERRRGIDRCGEMLDELAAFPITFEAVTRDRVLAAAHIKARYALSYADAFAVALAQELDAEIVAGDPEFRQVENLVSTLWL
jgi:ribonuclease VapC